MVAATYQMQVDTNRDGNYSGTYDDVTSRLVGSADFSFGMSDAAQDFATPSRLTVQLDNTDGAFNPDTLGSELLTNGNFASWAGAPSAPSSWTVTGQVASDPIVSQVGASQLFGGAGTGSANFFATSAVISISQVVLTIGTTYKATFDISATSGGSGWIALYSGTTRVSYPYHLAGTYTVYFTADSTTFKIASSGSVNMTIDNVSVKTTSIYGNRLSEGTLCRLRATYSAVAYTLFIGRLSSFTLSLGTLGKQVATLVFSDPTLDLLDTEYIPPLYTNTTADGPMAAIFTEPIVPFPYANNFWILGAQGASELDISTYLYSPPSNQFEVGNSIYSWVGDNSIDTDGNLKNKGVSAQSFIRDLVAGEVGGRFFYDPHSGTYTFHNRTHDALNSTVGFTVANGDYEPDMSVFVREEVLNHSSVSYQPRKAGAAGSVIYSRTLNMGAGTVQWTARYMDLTNPNARIGATDIIPPFAGVDYICVDANTGADVTSAVTVTAKAGANSAEMTVVNGSHSQIVFSVLQLRGTPLTTFESQTIESVNVDSEHAYKRATERISYKLIDTDTLAQGIADYRVYKNSVPISAFEKLGFIANKTNTRMVFALSAAVGDRITINDTWLNHSADYVIVGGRTQITWSGDYTHAITFSLKPMLREMFWVLDTSLLDISTRLGL